MYIEWSRRVRHSSLNQSQRQLGLPLLLRAIKSSLSRKAVGKSAFEAGCAREEGRGGVGRRYDTTQTPIPPKPRQHSRTAPMTGDKCNAMRYATPTVRRPLPLPPRSLARLSTHPSIHRPAVPESGADCADPSRTREPKPVVEDEPPEPRRPMTSPLTHPAKRSDHRSRESERSIKRTKFIHRGLPTPILHRALPPRETAIPPRWVPLLLGLGLDPIERTMQVAYDSQTSPEGRARCSEQFPRIGAGQCRARRALGGAPACDG